MSEKCNMNCESCSESCDDRNQQQAQSFIEKPHELSDIKNVIGIVSGKGGVGKSLVTALLAVEFQRMKYKTAILDADMTGPTIPKVFGINKKAEGCENGILPVKTKMNTEIMSINLLLENETDPVIWRGPILAGAVKQFWKEVIWNDVDYMFVDMPPGTGDVPLTVFQTIPLNGIIIVASPQELVGMIVSKAVKMANMMNIPVLGIIENMSYLKCPDCEKKINLFGESHVDEVAKQFGIPLLAKIPIDPELARLCDNGMIELFVGDWLKSAVEQLETQI